MAESLGKMPFGKFKGHDIEDIPTWHLTFIKGEKWFQDNHKKLCENILKELKYRKQFGDPDFD
jgi:uncharacterized protein (DUF3820 family)